MAKSRVLQTGKNQITQKYKTAHKAIDLVKYKSQLDGIIAHSDGIVVWVQTGQKNDKLSYGDKSYGNAIKIDHGNGYETLYAHLSNVYVKKGNAVKKGDLIGYMGNTGRSFGAHLHFELRKDGKKIDPTEYLERDLPKPTTAEPKAKYKAYAGKWYAEVTDYNNKDTNGYAGVQGKKMTALAVKSTKGTIKYRAHLLNGEWLDWVDDYDTKKTSGYAGIVGLPIDALQMHLVGLDGYHVKYRVSNTKTKGWYNWCEDMNDPTGDGYAGVFGFPIDCIQIDIVKEK